MNAWSSLKTLPHRTKSATSAKRKPPVPDQDSDGGGSSDTAEVPSTYTPHTSWNTSACAGLTRVKLFGERHSATEATTGWLRAKVATERARVLAAGPNWTVRLQHMLEQEGVALGALLATSKEAAYFGRTYDENLGWKHGLVNASRLAGSVRHNCTNTLVVCAARHPLDWLMSMQRETYASDPPMGGWHARRRLMPFAVESVPFNTLENRSYPNPVRMWSDKLQACIDLARWGCSVFVSRLEDLQRGGEGCRLVAAFPCPLWRRDSAHVRTCARSAGPSERPLRRPSGFDGRLVLDQTEARAASKAPVGLTRSETEALSRALVENIDPEVVELTRYDLSVPQGPPPPRKKGAAQAAHGPQPGSERDCDCLKWIDDAAACDDGPGDDGTICWRACCHPAPRLPVSRGTPWLKEDTWASLFSR